MKRSLDIFVSAIGLIILFPILTLIAISIRINMGKPILFKQVRAGKDTKPFEIVKFRTMLEAYDSDGHLLDDDARLSSLGKFLRRTSLDELPELLNVLRGEMSLVGPRPLLMSYLPLYSTEQARRHEVLPGITGWAQVNGRNQLSWNDRFKLDVWYVDNHSFVLDLKILVMTFKKVLTGNGVSAVGMATMSKFEGNKNGSSK